MATVIKDLSSPELVPALENNMFEFWSTYGRATGRGLYIGKDYIRVLTGIPFPIFNGVFRAQLSPETIDDAISDTLAAIKTWKVPLFWWVGPGTQPSNLGEHLERHGFHYTGSMPGMAIDLSILKEDGPQPHNFTIRPVENNETLETWVRVAAKGFDIPASIHDSIVDLERSVGAGPDVSPRRYIGYQNGVPVATSGMFIHSGVAAICWVATLPEARRQGIGAAMTRMPLIDARLKGYRVSTLVAMEMGHSVYKKLGFQDVCSISLYLAGSEL
ncbi:GNAT family N-acetyltransferase [Candidatus Poribacteria bacterium]|nr:GNAT family N-acetyltransferase [Candidatus Poribacteria bacterium]